MPWSNFLDSLNIKLQKLTVIKELYSPKQNVKLLIIKSLNLLKL